MYIYIYIRGLSYIYIYIYMYDRSLIQPPHTTSLHGTATAPRLSHQCHPSWEARPCVRGDINGVPVEVYIWMENGWSNMALWWYNWWKIDGIMPYFHIFKMDGNIINFENITANDDGLVNVSNHLVVMVNRGKIWHYDAFLGFPQSHGGNPLHHPSHGWPWLSIETHGDDWGFPIASPLSGGATIPLDEQWSICSGKYGPFIDDLQIIFLLKPIWK